jgi:hypothetical protein
MVSVGAASVYSTAAYSILMRLGHINVNVRVSHNFEFNTVGELKNNNYSLTMIVSTVTTNDE